MNIQPVNQNSNCQQNFGLKLNVVADKVEKATLEQTTRKIFAEINHYITPELREKITLAMQDAGEKTDVFVHALAESGGILLTQSVEKKRTPHMLAILSFVKKAEVAANPPLEEALREPFETLIQRYAVDIGEKLLTFFRNIRPIPKNARTEAGFAEQIQIIG